MAGLLGPGLFTYVFSRTIGGPEAWFRAPGTAFFVAAGSLLLSLLVSEMVRPARGMAAASA